MSNNPDRIAEIRARCEDATPGPWRICDRKYNIELHDSHTWGKALSPFAHIESDEWKNAEFIANAREDIPYLLEQLEKAESQTNKFAKALSKVTEDNPLIKSVLAKAHAEIERQREVVSAQKGDLINANMNLEHLSDIADMDRWRSAEEVPEQCGNYRVWVKTNEWSDHECVDQYNSVLKVWQYDAVGWGKVTHWRPLPAAPEEPHE